MLCKQCGKELNNAAVFCPECGASQFTYTPDQVHNGSVGVGEAIVLFFQNYANFKGRASRSEYWWVFLFNVLLNIFILGVIAVIFPPLALMCWMALLIPGLALFCRRMHDTGKSGAYFFVSFIPIAGLVLVLVQLCLQSDRDNKWGPGPKDAFPRPVNVQGNNNTGQQTKQPVINLKKDAVVAVEGEKVANHLKKEEEPAPKTVTDEEVLSMVHSHEPLNMSSPYAKRMLDYAVCGIIPTYEENKNIAEAMLQCEPQEIKAKIAAADNDTLCVIYKALEFYVNQGADAEVLGMVQKHVLTTLKSRI